MNYKPDKEDGKSRLYRILAEWRMDVIKLLGEFYEAQPEINRKNQILNWDLSLKDSE